MERKIVVVDESNSIISSGVFPQYESLDMDTSIDSKELYRELTKHIWRVLRDNFEMSEISASVSKVKILNVTDSNKYLTWDISGEKEDIVLTDPFSTTYHYTEF